MTDVLIVKHGGRTNTSMKFLYPFSDSIGHLYLLDTPSPVLLINILEPYKLERLGGHTCSLPRHVNHITLKKNNFGDNDLNQNI